LNESGTIEKVLEIKCPISCKDKLIVDSNKNTNVKYLECDKTTGKLHLKSRHVYYTQCQLLMHCSGLNSCDLFVYYNIEPILVTVEKKSTIS